MQSTVSLTFDDGLRCQFQSALPILNSHGMRATFFLIANRNPTHDLWSGHTEELVENRMECGRHCHVARIGPRRTRDRQS